jgi:hypothetical protein
MYASMRKRRSYVSHIAPAASINPPVMRALDQWNQALRGPDYTLGTRRQTAAHLARLRHAGFRDAEIFEIVMVTAYYALRCRMADALEVEVDRRSQQGMDLVDAFVFRPEIVHESADSR